MATTAASSERRSLVGPLLAAVAVLSSLSVLAWSYFSQEAETPVLLRLSIAAEREALEEANSEVHSIPARAASMSAAESAVQRARVVTDRMLDVSSAPEVVKYKVERGGTVEDVANMFGIFHHEMLELNPGVGLQSMLQPGSRVVVYRREQAGTSRSLGRAADGKLEGAVPMIPGPGRILRRHRLKCWATASTVARMDWVLKQWAQRYPDAHPILVGNLSLRGGGKVRPHKSHQSGRDVDISYVEKWDGVSEPHWQKMGSSNLDAERTWNLLELLRETDAISVIYIDHSIQKLLYDHAVANGRFTAAELEVWMQYPEGPAAERGIIRHAPGHVDHIHVRFQCSPTDEGCEDSAD